MTLEKILGFAYENECSDIHLAIGSEPAMRKNGKIFKETSLPLITEQAMQEYIMRFLFSVGIKEDPGVDIDLCFSTEDNRRYRINIFKKQNKRAAAIRVLNPIIPTLEEMNLPEIFKDIASNKNGLILVTGPTGSGKSTTLAAMLNYINLRDCSHILTFEDPVEFLYKDGNCMVSQREVGRDAKSFSDALRSALREDPDIILVGEMRDLETISATLTAAETGHLVMSTLHTMGAAKTIDRIIDVFPTYQQQQVRTQLAGTLRAVISQILLPTADGNGRVPAFEILIVNQAVASCIKQSKIGQIYSTIQTGAKEGMVTLDTSIKDLIKNEKVKLEDVEKYVKDKDILTTIGE